MAIPFIVFIVRWEDEESILLMGQAWTHRIGSNGFDFIPHLLPVPAVAVRLCVLYVLFKPASHQPKGSVRISFATDLTIVR